MPTLYAIKPKNDGYYTLGYNLAGQFFLIKKDNYDTSYMNEITFHTLDEANEFINKYNLNEKYEPEEFWVNEEYYTKKIQKELDNIISNLIIHCPDCGHSLRCMCTVGADESHSQFTESLYHCENCLCDYNIARDSKGNFVKMTRHFWG